MKKKYAKRAIALILSLVLAFGGSVMTVFAAVPYINEVKPLNSELPSTGGTVDVEVTGTDLPSTLYYRVKVKDEETGYYSALVPETAAEYKDGKITINIPANTDSTDKLCRISVSDTSNKYGTWENYDHLTLKGVSGGDTSVCTDENTFRAKVVDAEGNPLSNVPFVIKLELSRDERRISTNENGILEYTINASCSCEHDESFIVSVAGGSYKSEPADYSFETDMDGLIKDDYWEEVTFILTPGVDKTALKQAIETAKPKIEADYTPESWTPFKTALDEANTCDADKNATQDEVNAKAQALNDAMAALKKKPTLESATANPTELSSKGGEVEVTVVGQNLPETLYYKLQEKSGSYWMDLDPDVAESGVKEAPIADGKITVVLPANNTENAKEYRVVADYVNTLNKQVVKTGSITVKAPEGGDTPILSDATTFRVKVVDEAGNLLDGIKFEMDYNDGFGATSVYEPSSNGVFQYEPNKYWDRNATINFSVVAGQKASETENWVCTDTHTITTDGNAQITQVDGVELALPKEVVYTLKKEAAPEPVPAVTELKIAVKDKDGKALSNISFKAVDVDLPESTPDKYVSDYDGVLTFEPKVSYTNYALQLDDNSEYTSNPEIIYITVNGKKEITEIKIGEETYEPEKECEFVLTRKGEEPVEPDNKTITFKTEDTQGEAVNDVSFDIIDVEFPTASYEPLKSAKGSFVFNPDDLNEEVVYDIQLVANSGYKAEPEKYTVKVNAQNEIAEVNEVPYDLNTEYKFVLTPDSGSVDKTEIKIKVFDYEGTIREGVKFELVDTSQADEYVAELVTDKDGILNYSLTELQNGTYRVNLASSEKTTWKILPKEGITYQVSDHKIVTVNGKEPADNVEITLYPLEVPYPADPLKTITVKVVDKDGKALSDVQFRVVEKDFIDNQNSGQKVKSDEEGKLTYKVSATKIATTYVIELIDKDYESEKASIEFKTNKEDQIVEVDGKAYNPDSEYKFELTKKPAEEPVDKSALEKKLKEVKAIEQGNYTKESYDALQKAIEEAEAVMNNKDATKEDVDKAVTALDAAEKALKEIELPYKDIPEEDEWYRDAVKYVYDNQIMTGLSETTFGPYETLSRAQFAVIIHRMSGSPEVEYKNTFPDVEKGTWYTNAVLWANENEIITGYSHNGMFGPADLITREQMAVIMYRYAKAQGYDVSTKADFSKFKDAGSVSGFAEEAMQWAVGTGIISGKDEGTRIDPQGYAARAECAVIITRFMKANK